MQGGLLERSLLHVRTPFHCGFYILSTTQENCSSRLLALLKLMDNLATIARVRVSLLSLLLLFPVILVINVRFILLLQSFQSPKHYL